MHIKLQFILKYNDKPPKMGDFFIFLHRKGRVPACKNAARGRKPTNVMYICLK